MIKAQSFKCRFLEAGLSTIGDGKTLLIKNEDLMRFAEKFKGFPVIVDHTDLNSGNVSQLKVGVITSVWKGEDGWAWCEMLIDDLDAIQRLSEGWLVSCMYYIKNEGSSGLYHDIPYDLLVIEIEPNHLAIVENPRYEDVVVIKNSKSKAKSMFKFLSKNKKDEAIKNSMEEVENAVYMDGDKEIPMAELVENYKKAKAANSKRIMNAEDEMEVDGENVRISDMVDAVNAHKAKNESSKGEQLEKETEESKKEAKEVEGAENSKPAEETESKAEEEKEKAEEEKKSENSKEAAPEEDLEGFKKIKNNITKFREEAAEEAKAKPEKSFVTENEKFARGRARYGSKQTAKKS